jgi:hypothetical protein
MVELMTTTKRVGVDAVAEQEGDHRRNEEGMDKEVVDMGEETSGERATLPAGRRFCPFALSRSAASPEVGPERGLGAFAAPPEFGRRGLKLHCAPLRTAPA